MSFLNVARRRPLLSRDGPRPYVIHEIPLHPQGVELGDGCQAGEVLEGPRRVRVGQEVRVEKGAKAGCLVFHPWRQIPDL